MRLWRARYVTMFAEKSRPSKLCCYVPGIKNSELKIRTFRQVLAPQHDTGAAGNAHQVAPLIDRAVPIPGTGAETERMLIAYLVRSPERAAGLS